MKSMGKIITMVMLLLAFTFTSNVNAFAVNNDNYKKEVKKPKEPKEPKKPKEPKEPKKPKDKNNGDAIPLDGGLSILLAGAAIFGVKKLREKK